MVLKVSDKQDIQINFKKTYLNGNVQYTLSEAVLVACLLHITWWSKLFESCSRLSTSSSPVTAAVIEDIPLSLEMAEANLGSSEEATDDFEAALTDLVADVGIELVLLVGLAEGSSFLIDFFFS